ncbi:MAG: enoyl-CoA hydratase/isomerase family protein [Actinomycetota bacterium]
MTTDDISYEVIDRVAVITLDAPERRNTITPRMLDDLAQQLLRAEQDPEARCVVLTGAGTVFCAGLDLASTAKGEGMLDSPSDASPPPGELPLRDIPPIVLHKMDTPTICALNGGAAGYGLDVALGCDIRIAHPKVKLAAVFTRRAILPESGGTWLLPRLVGWARASEILFAGKTLTADEAVEIGLVNRLVDVEKVLDEAMDLATEIAANAPLAVRATKRMMRHAATENFEDHVQRQYLGLLPLMRTKDFREGAMAYMEKRDPDFQGR